MDTDLCAQRKDHVRTQQEGDQLPAKERSFKRNQPCWHLDFGLLASKRELSENKFLLLRPLRLLYFVMAAIVNEYSHWYILVPLDLKYCVYLFLAVLGLCCCVRAFSSWGEQGLLSRSIVQVSHCGGFSCCRAWAPGMQALVAVVHRLSCSESCGILVPQPRTEPMFPALAGWFLTTGPPGKCQIF